MKIRMVAAAAILVLLGVSAPAKAQTEMTGMPMPTTGKHTVRKHYAVKNRRVANMAAKRHSKTSQFPVSGPNPKHPNSDGETSPKSPMAAMSMPFDQKSMPSASQPKAVGQSQMQQGSGSMAMPTTALGKSAQAEPMAMPMGSHTDQQMPVTGALGPYGMEREASGTAWQPDTSEHTGLMTMAGAWTFMAHGAANLVYDHQSGPRGNDKAFASGMLMGMARRPIGNGTLQFKAMISPDPLMGADGYPLLLASGETANGKTPLIDRQHPHDFFMELSASISQSIGSKSSLFLYGGLPGEPAFGPPAFMHRESILNSPEAPITHHWLDSTHISFGVLTAGLVIDQVKVEVSRFNAREPDQHRWDIETGPLDSTSVRVSWNPTSALALQASWAFFKDPEQLEPGVDQKRLSASALWSETIAPGWKAAVTLAWGRKTIHGQSDNGAAAEGSLEHASWTLFGRAEMVQNRELLGLQENAIAYRVGKVSLGVVRDFRVAGHLSIGLGGLFSLNFVPNALAPLYGSRNPTGTMGFIRLKLN